MKASVAFVLLAFLSATTAKVHVQNRKASKVIEDPDEANNLLKRASACMTCPLTGVRCCLPSVCWPTDGKCSNNPLERVRETTERSKEQLFERGEEFKEKIGGWR